mmetsp:Transcript_22633/g.55829  ORF Transcript_22633/g.55829 Transcript_22633/m.55829 type:complete len:494 (-) Transcript_22633:8-1489(-)
MQIRVPDLRQKQSLDGSFELRRDGLWFVRDVHLRQLSVVIVRLEQTSQHPDECRFAGTVLAEHDDDLGVAEVACLHMQLELAAHRLGQGRILRRMQPLDLFIERLGDPEVERLIPESEVLGGNEAVEEDVDALPHRERGRDHAVDPRAPPQTADEVGQVVQHRQVVLNHDDVVVVFDDGPDGLCGLEPLPDVEVAAGLVKHVNIGARHAHHTNGEPLQLTARQLVNLSCPDVLQVKCGHERLPLVHLVLDLDDPLDGPLDVLGDAVDVLRLDRGLQAVLEDAREVALQLAAAEVPQHLLPVRRRVVLTQIGLQLACQDLEGRRLADAVGADESEHLAWPRHRQAVQLECVGTETVRGVLAEVLGKVNDVDGLKGALLDADSAADAQRLRDEGDLGGRLHLDAELAGAVDGAVLLALLPALLGLASVLVDDGDAQLGLIHRLLLLLALRSHKPYTKVSGDAPREILSRSRAAVRSTAHCGSCGPQRTSCVVPCR